MREAELARRIANSSDTRDIRDAEAELCRAFAQRIRLYGLRHLRDEERARDLVQVVLLKVIEALRAGRVEDPERIDRFVLGTCRNVSLREREREARTELADPVALDTIAVPFEDTSAPLDFGALVRCMAELDARDRTILHLSFYRDRSSEEIAGALELTAGNVRVVRHRAMGRLRRCLEGPEAHP